MEWIKFWQGRRALRASEVVDATLDGDALSPVLRIVMRTGEGFTLFRAEATEALLVLQLDLKWKE